LYRKLIDSHDPACQECGVLRWLRIASGSGKRIAISGGLMTSPLIANSFAGAVDQGTFGFASVSLDGVVLEKSGSLSSWLPEQGRNCFDNVLLLGMKDEFAAVARGDRQHIVLPAVVLPAVQLPAPGRASTPVDGPITILALWDEPSHYFTIITMVDFASRQIEIVLGSERRARRLAEEQLEAANAELRLAAVTRERLRLARDLHDTLAQSVLALLMQVRLIADLVRNRPQQVLAELGKAEDAAVQALDRARKAIARIRSPEMEESETFEPLEQMARRFADRTEIETAVEIDAGFDEIPRDISEPLCRIVAEALRNIETHANATRVGISARRDDTAPVRRVVVTVEDNGVGFDPALPKANHFGLIGMRELAAQAGGTCRIESAAGSGTRIEITISATDALATGSRA
jgi:signal transduction histidine kinase